MTATLTPTINMATNSNSSSSSISYWVGSDSGSDQISLCLSISETRSINNISNSSSISSSRGYWVGSDSSSDQLSLRLSIFETNNSISSGSADVLQRQKAMEPWLHLALLLATNTGQATNTHVGCVKTHHDPQDLIPSRS